MTEASPAPPAQGGFETWARLAAHQLGEGLALVRGAATVLEASDAAVEPDVESAITTLRAGAQRGQRFVDDLLDLVQMSQPPAGDEPVAADLDSGLEAARAELADALHDAGTELRVASELPGAAVDRSEAARLFVHLLRSAMAAGARTVEVSATDDGELTRIEVVDDGAALPDEPAGDEALAVPRGRGPLVGAGISLLICRRIAERRGGGLSIEARDGGTTAATVTVPRPAG
jgi:signal transduction histidine kinase